MSMSDFGFMLLLVGLIAIVNPLGALPVFLSMSDKSNPDADMRTIKRAAISVALILLIAEKMRAKLGTTGLNIATRIMGLILTAIGVQFISDGIRQLLPGLA